MKYVAMSWHSLWAMFSIAAFAEEDKLPYGTTSVLFATTMICLLENKGRIDSKSFICWSKG